MIQPMILLLMFLFPLTSRVLMTLLLYCCLLLACVYSPLHCTLLPTIGDTVIGPRDRQCRARAAQCPGLSGASCRPGVSSEAGVRARPSTRSCHCPAKQPSRPTSIFSNHSFHFLSLGSLSSNNTSRSRGAHP